MDASGSRQSLAELNVVDLIDRLRDEAEDGVGYHRSAKAIGFIALDQEPRFGGGIIGSRSRHASRVMRELVRRGLDALPGLLDHLTDERPTRLLLSNPLGAMWHADESDPRYADAKRQPASVNTIRFGRGPDRRFIPPVRQYRLRVGDLCFVAVGQIVNRELNAVRYQPTLCVVINSPAQTPALAAAVRKD
jgi:hypothetical protein